jgi:ketosteroid isomerase-like protein
MNRFLKNDADEQFREAVNAAISSAGAAERAKLARLIETYADDIVALTLEKPCRRHVEASLSCRLTNSDRG